MSVLAFMLMVILGVTFAARAASATTQVAVVVAARDMPHRHLIQPGDLTTTRLSTNSVPPGALVSQSQATGLVAQVDLLKGQPITRNVVAAQGKGDPALLPIPKGWVAVTIPAGEQQAVGGYVSPGDWIDVSATVAATVFSPETKDARQLTRTVFPNVEVIRVGPAADQGGTQNGAQPGKTQGVASSLTVLATPCDAEYLTWLVGNGSVRYSLRAGSDYGTVPKGPDQSCPAGTALAPIGPAEVDARFGFSKA